MDSRSYHRVANESMTDNAMSNKFVSNKTFPMLSIRAVRDCSHG